MLKTKIYASGINNLSDARYFAAMGVDYLGYPLDSTLSSQQIKEMIEWVEGPEAIGEVLGIDSSPLLLEDVANLGLDLISTSPFFTGYLPPSITHLPQHILTDNTNLDDDGILIIETPFHEMDEGQMNRIQRLCNQFQLWLSLPFLPKHIDRLLSTFQPKGLVIKGGDEEKPGVRTFDELDEIFEVLLIEE